MSEDLFSEATKPIRFKVIKAVYEKLVIKESSAGYAAKTVSTAQDVYSLFSFLNQETKEYFIALHLDVKNRILCIDKVAVGNLTSAIVHPREVFKTALLSSAASLLLVHNHPSGDPLPSQHDIDLTERLKKASEIMGISLLDHVIIGDGKYASLKEKGYL